MNRRKGTGSFTLSVQVGGAGEPGDMIPLALVRMTEPINNGTAENAPAMPRVAILMSSNKQMAVIHAGTIDGAAHVVPLLPDEGKNRRWIVNTHIDLET